ncbi:MAG: Dabb family protein [Actinobacteria bacterium]|nr:Dabb family protein [Actinomycetota bacterium]
MSVFHVAIFRFNEGVTDDQIEWFTDGLIALKEQMPMLLSFRFGRDLGLRDGNYDYGVVAELEGPESVDVYLDHPLHQVFVEEYVTVMVAERRAVQVNNLSGR